MNPTTPACTYVETAQVQQLLPSLQPLLTDPSKWNYPDCIYTDPTHAYQLHLQILFGGAYGDAEEYLKADKDSTDQMFQKLGFEVTFSDADGLGPGAFILQGDPVPGKQDASTSVTWVYGGADVQLSFNSTDTSPVSSDALVTLAQQITANFNG